MKTDRQLREEIAHNRKLLRQRKRQALGLPKRAKGKMCRLVDRDENLKLDRGYTNPGSYVRRDGSEVLKGEDWKRRVGELRERSGGRCEQHYLTPDNPGCLYRCSMPSRDPHHKIKRSIRRDDRLSNLEDLCRPHHDERDNRKPKWSRQKETA